MALRGVSAYSAEPASWDLEADYPARDAELDRLVGSLDAFELAATTADHIRRALRFQAHGSQPARTQDPDLIVAAAAETLKLTMLHYEADVELIAGITGQPTQRDEPPGSAD